jgi:hypothetical protein
MSRIINSGCLRREYRTVGRDPKPEDRDNRAPIDIVWHEHGYRMSPMKIPALPFTVTDWSQIAATTHAGECGQAFWRTLDIGDVRVRMVEYTPGYLADHWCDRGHVLYVLEGELETELRDGRSFTLRAGMSYQVSDFGDAAHRSSTKTGAKLFIVD